MKEVASSFGNLWLLIFCSIDFQLDCVLAHGFRQTAPVLVSYVGEQVLVKV